MDMLPLDDSRWNDLNHRGWSHGKRSEWDRDAPFVPEELGRLVENPGDTARFNELWPYLCSEGTTWAAAYAAVPYAISLAKRLPAQERFDYLYFVGLVVMCSCRNAGDAFEIKPFLLQGYRQALSEALRMLAETIVSSHDGTQTRYLLAAVAALKGHPKLADVLNHMDCICGICPKCGEHVYPEELQEGAN